MRVSNSALSLFTLADVMPQTTLGQVRANLRLGIVLRWLAIALVAVAGMLSPRVPPLLLVLLASYTCYNAAVWMVVSRVPDRWARRTALAVTIVDQLGCFSFLPIYATVVPGGESTGGYMIGVIEAVTFFGAPGAVLSVSLFLGCALAFQAVNPSLFQRAFNSTGVAGAVLMISLLSVILVAATRTLTLTRVRAPEAAFSDADGDADGELGPPEPGVRLTPREQEVLRLVAEGYSNTMIAGRLRLSNSTVKSYVENLLIRLNVRNRAEAVAAASRLRLL